MNRILSDISQRIMIVEGKDMVVHVEETRGHEGIMTVEPFGNDVYRVTIIHKVGDYFGNKEGRK